MVIGAENITIAKLGSVTSGPAISGTLTPALQATIRAQVSGSVISTNSDVGRTVKRGQVLGEIDASAIRDAYYSAKSGVASAQSAYNTAEHDLQRDQTLLNAGAISPRDLETAQQMYANAQASLESAKAQLANAQKNLDNTRIIAPFSGIVSQRSVSAGDVVQPGSVLFTVVDPSSMELDASVPSDQLGDVHVGTEVSFTVTGYPNRNFIGKIIRVSPAADPATRQVPIAVAIPNTTRTLVAGLYADGRLSSRKQTGVIIPQSAVDVKLQRPAVVRIHNGKVERAEVTLGMRDDHAETVQVTSGINQGDTLLVAAAQGITPGTPVRVQSQPRDSVKP
jgi:RND family efflux transporter MFP subunit